MVDPAELFELAYGAAWWFWSSYERTGRREDGWACVRLYVESMTEEEFAVLADAFANPTPGTFGTHLVDAIATERLLRRAAALHMFREVLDEITGPR